MQFQIYYYAVNRHQIMYILLKKKEVVNMLYLCVGNVKVSTIRRKTLGKTKLRIRTSIWTLEAH